MLHKVSSWKREDFIIYIYIYKPNTLLSLRYKKFPSVIANFHLFFHKTTMQASSHLTYCTPINSALCFASSVCCVSKFNVSFSVAHIITKDPFLSPNHTTILCIILVFLSSSTLYRESPIFGCLPLLFKYICSYLPYLEALPSICCLMNYCVLMQRSENS